MTFVKLKEKDNVFITSIKAQGRIYSISEERHTAEVIYAIAYEEGDSVIETKKHFPLSDLVKVQKNGKKSEADPNKWYNIVRNFQKVFAHPFKDKPTQMDLNRAINRSVWTGEEALVEFIHASSNSKVEFDAAFEEMIEGLRKAKVKSDGMEFYEEGVERIVAQADALTDAMWFILGSFVEMGVKPDKLLEIVEDSNLSKLFEDGKPRFREGDNKILKSPQFFAPEPFLKAEIERQLNQ